MKVGDRVRVAVDVLAAEDAGGFVGGAGEITTIIGSHYYVALDGDGGGPVVFDAAELVAEGPVRDLRLYLVDDALAMIDAMIAQGEEAERK